MLQFHKSLHGWPVLVLLALNFLPGQCLSSVHNRPSSMGDQVRFQMNISRKDFLRQAVGSAFVFSGVSLTSSSPAHASNNDKSRTDGYSVQKTDAEWQSLLSPTQYYILRQGGTERPYSSILESEKREGVYKCAGCGTPLFASPQKFHSGTGWPSFARGLPGVQVEDVSAVQKTLVGAELRCTTCGGHLGDVFADGFLFVGTPAFASGQRYCIDGAALIFEPQEEPENVVRGDLPPPSSQQTSSMPSWLEPPSIEAK